MNSKMGAVGRWLACALIATGLAGLGACGDDDEPPQQSSGAEKSIGSAGGTVTHSSGASVTVPAGALASDVTIGIDVTTAGAAPALPENFNAAGTMYVITPHGQTFTHACDVTIPFDSAQVPAGARLTLFKTTNGASGPWTEVPGSVTANGKVTGQVSTFSVVVAGFLPQITSQPQTSSVVEGQNAVFSVTAIGFNPPFTYQWQRSNDGGATYDDIVGASAASYTIVAATGDTGARVRVIVANASGSVTSDPAELTVTSSVVAPSITMQPQDASVASGANATFTVVASGTTLSYQWQRSDDGGQIFADIATGANGSSYVLANAQAGSTPLGDGGAMFRVRVSNTAGMVTSAAATLTVTSSPPPPPGTAAHLAAGDNFTIVQPIAGQLRSWGSDAIGALGDGAGDSSRNVPGLVSVLSGASAIAAGFEHALAIGADGRVYGWGYNGFGQLGNGSNQTVFAPVAMIGATLQTAPKIAVAGGTLHSLILRNDGVVEATGSNGFGQLGDGTTNDRSEALPVPNLANVVAISAGGRHSLALLQNGDVWAWGDNIRGQLGDDTTADRYVPTPVSGLSGIKLIAGGDDFSMAATDDTLWAWGSNESGKLGDGTEVDRHLPVIVNLPAGFATPIKAIAAGSQFAMALDSSGVVYTWGSNEIGQLGSGSLSPGFRTEPLPVPAFPPAGRTVIAIEAGTRFGLEHVLALLDNGDLWVWGYNDVGQLGVGSSTFIFKSPVQVPALNLH
jgi:alpha-tubulin suppressor-like RCC1 family protein